MPNLQRAIEIAVAAHRGATDKTGQPYILHPMRVMLSVEGDEAKIVAMLHDVVEDTPITLDDLRQEGFPEVIVRAVELVTREKGTSYAEYVVRAKSHTLSRTVKLADLNDNARLDRALLRSESAEKDYRRLHRYHLAYKFLTDQLSEPEFMHLMAAEESAG